MTLVRDKLFWAAFAEHAKHTVDASRLLVEMLQHLDRREVLASAIKELEHAGDEITRNILQALHQTWITPLDREEIHNLIGTLDDVLDVLESASDRIVLYDIREVRHEAVELALSLSRSAEEILKAVHLLSNLKESQAVRNACRAISVHEREADRIARSALARLFVERGDAIEIVKWRDIFDALESATDRADDVANVLEGIVLEHA